MFILVRRWKYKIAKTTFQQVPAKQIDKTYLRDIKEVTLTGLKDL